VIHVTRLNGSQVYINAEHVQAVESTPDTHIQLTNGQVYITRNSADDIARLMIDYQKRVRGII
jgi:flagellar protein FlbD